MAAMLALIIAVPVALMGVGVAAAASFVPMGHTAAGMPIYDLQETLARPEYSDVQIDTTQVRFSDITNVDGFDYATRDSNPSFAHWVHAWKPNKKGASLVVNNIGSYRAADGTKHTLRGRYTVNDSSRTMLSLNGHAQDSTFLFGSEGMDDDTGRGTRTMDYTITLLDDTGNPLPQSTKGVAGFQDLDGDPNVLEEGVELLGGYDGAYVRRDTHLRQYGHNGWNGGADLNENLNDAHAQLHYLGATFTGNTLHTRFTTDFYRQNSIQPIKALVAYKLKYDPNAPDTNNGVPAMNGDGIPTQGVKNGCLAYYVGGDTINLATGAKDGDCWDSSLLTRPGYTFKGWSPDRNASAPQAQITMPHENTTVYAIWVKNVRFTYDADKPAEYTGSMPGVPDAREFSPGATVPNTSPWKTGATNIIRGWRFDGWRVSRDDKSAVYGFDTTPITQDTTVYGSWTPLTINLHYDPNGGEGSHPSQNTRWDTTVTIPDDVNGSFHRDGFTLTGWNTQADGKGTAYQPGKGVPMVDHDVTLYAQWAPVATTMPETGSATLAWLIGGGALVLLIAVGAGVLVWRIRRKA